MDPIYEIKFNNPDYESHFQNGDHYNHNLDYQNNSTLTNLEIQLMIPALLLASCFMPIIYCFKACEIINYFRLKINNNSLTEILIENNLSDNCSICLEDYKKNDKCVKLNCNHIFHKKCLSDWFKNQISKSENLNCPLCRNNLF